jgi:hypothetical protein
MNAGLIKAVVVGAGCGGEGEDHFTLDKLMIPSNRVLVVLLAPVSRSYHSDHPPSDKESAPT